MTNPVSEDSDRRRILQLMIGLAAVPVGVAGVVRLPLISRAEAAGNPGAQPNQGDLVHIPAASAPTTMIAEWYTGDTDNTSGPFRIAASQAAFDKAPASAARYEAKLYNFPSGSLRRLTFKKGSPVVHLITFETEIYVLSGTASLTPLPGFSGNSVKVSAGDALFLPSGYLNSPEASEDFVILQAFVSRTVSEAKSAIIAPGQAVGSEIVEWEADGKEVRATNRDEIRRAPKNAHRLTLKRYVAEGNSIRVVTLRGSRGSTDTTSGTDVLIYIAKGRVRRKEGNQMLDLVAGDCMREMIGNPGYWEPLEESVFIATDAPMNPGLPPPANT
jgi:uncharacterized cupin superfamily protein